MQNVYRLMAGFFLTVVAYCIVIQVSIAQETPTSWTPTQHLDGTDGREIAPRLVPDSSGKVHAFSVGTGDASNNIIYRTWSHDEAWSEPVDIAFSEQDIPADGIFGVVLDDAGWLHLLVFLGNEAGAGIYYTRAPALEAANASAWSSLRLIGPDAGKLASGRLLAHGDHLIALYSGRGEGNGLYAVESTDGGDNWQEPLELYDTGDEEKWVFSINGDADESQFHAVWGIVGRSGNSEAIYYSRRSDAGGEWSEPFEMAHVAENGYESDWPTVISTDGELMVVYQNGSPARRWMRRSLDGGSTWSDPTSIFDLIGEYGFADIVTDSSQTPHMVLGGRLGDQAHGMWHSAYVEGRWTTPEAIVSGPRRAGIGLESFDPTWPSAAIVDGNEMLVTWMTDWGLEPNGVWYSSSVLDAPRLSRRPLPLPARPDDGSSGLSPLPTDRHAQDQKGTEPVSGTTLSGSYSQTIQPNSDASLAIVAGMVAAMMVVGAVLIGRVRR